MIIKKNIHIYIDIYYILYIIKYYNIRFLFYFILFYFISFLVKHFKIKKKKKRNVLSFFFHKIFHYLYIFITTIY